MSDNRPYSQNVMWIPGLAMYRTGGNTRESRGCRIRTEKSSGGYPLTDGVVIESINSRGQTGSAAIGIPTSEIPRVVGMLMDAYQSILNEEFKPFVIEPAPTTGE